MVYHYVHFLLLMILFAKSKALDKWAAIVTNIKEITRQHFARLTDSQAEKRCYRVVSQTIHVHQTLQQHHWNWSPPSTHMPHGGNLAPQEAAQTDFRQH